MLRDCESLAPLHDQSNTNMSIKAIFKRLFGRGAAAGSAGADEMIEAALGGLPSDVPKHIIASVRAVLKEQVRNSPGEVRAIVSFKLGNPPEPISILTRVGPVYRAAAELNRWVWHYKELKTQLNKSLGDLKRQAQVDQDHASKVFCVARVFIESLNGVAGDIAEQTGKLRELIARDLPGVQNLEIPEPPAVLTLPNNIDELVALYEEAPKPGPSGTPAGSEHGPE